MIINTELARLYISYKLLNKTTLEKILGEITWKNARLDEELLKRNLVTEENNAMILAAYLKMNYLDIDLIEHDIKVVTKVTADFIKRNNIMPISYVDDKLLIAVADPLNQNNLNKISSFSDGNHKIVVTSKSKLQKLKSIIFSKISTENAIAELDKNTGLDKTLDDKLEGADVTEAPAVKLTDSILRQGIAYGASDIHIEPYEKIIRVRYRVDGKLFESSKFDTELYSAVSTRIKIHANINIAERRIPQDGRINMTYNNIDYDFRVSTLPTIYGEKIVIRILDNTSFSFERKHLGFLESENKIIDKLITAPHGIVLLTGPTGCGKSSTLYSFINEINSDDVNIITVEDPIEYSLEGVNQVQVNNKSNLTFAAALRSILRQDPNIIMIGEIRDEETAQIAIRAAITGHLVFSTLHTNDATGAVTRLIDMGVEPYFVSDAVVGIIAQRLVRKLCDACKEKAPATEAEKEILNISGNKSIYHPKGCPACNYTGYSGRFGIHEVLDIDDNFKTLIQQKLSNEQLKKVAIENGMLTLRDTCIQAVLDGKTSIAELASITYED